MVVDGVDRTRRPLPYPHGGSSSGGLAAARADARDRQARRSAFILYELFMSETR